MIDHVAIRVSDVARSRRFYERALAPLGYHVVVDISDGAGLGRGDSPDFWLIRGEPGHTGVHVAFRSDDRDAVDAFHDAALQAGGIDNGEPGVRERYHPAYYAAFVYDPDGNNVEAVCHEPPSDDDGSEEE